MLMKHPTLLTTLIPWFGGSLEPLKRTIESTKGIADETLVVHQQLFDEDAERVRSVADKVQTVPWNAVFTHGFGWLANQHQLAAGKWILLLGTAETIAEEYYPIRKMLEGADIRTTFRCNHLNDTNDWHRIWCPASGVSYGGVIHESVGGGHKPGPIIFRMQDTPKEPPDDPFHAEVFRWKKTTSYNFLYRRLLRDPSQLSYTDPGWLNFVRGAADSIEGFCEEHRDLIDAAVSGDRQAFLDGVRSRMDAEKPAVGVNFEPLGEERSGDETIPEAA